VKKFKKRLISVVRGRTSSLATGTKFPFHVSSAKTLKVNRTLVITVTGKHWYKVSLLTARVRLFDCRRDCAAGRRFQFHKRRQLFIGVHNETLSVAGVREQARLFVLHDPPKVLGAFTDNYDTSFAPESLVILRSKKF
jgi:hypothetical protein